MIIAKTINPGIAKRMANTTKRTTAMLAVIAIPTMGKTINTIIAVIVMPTRIANNPTKILNKGLLLLKFINILKGRSLILREVCAIIYYAFEILPFDIPKE